MRFPTPGWVKFNVDDLVRGAQRLAGCGGVCRDDTGRWLLGFCRNIGSSNVLVAEF